MENLHFKEDTTKPENRTNLALLGILQISDVRDYMLKALRLPQDSLVFPCPNLEVEEFVTAQRPDFVVRDVNGVDLGFIEVELGPENREQVQRYRDTSCVPVFSLVGKQSYQSGDLSLQELRDHTRSIQRHYVGKQQSVSLELFCRLVEYYVIEGKFRPSCSRSAVSDAVLASPLGQLLSEHFGPRAIAYSRAGVERGRILLDSVSHGGLSVRVYSTETGSRGFSVMSRTSGRSFCEFPSCAKLRKYFPYSLEPAERLAHVVASLGDPDVLQLPENRRARLPLRIVEENFPVLAEAISDLMG